MRSNGMRFDSHMAILMYLMTLQVQGSKLLAIDNNDQESHLLDRIGTIDSKCRIQLQRIGIQMVLVK